MKPNRVYRIYSKKSSPSRGENPTQHKRTNCNNSAPVRTVMVIGCDSYDLSILRSVDENTYSTTWGWVSELRCGGNVKQFVTNCVVRESTHYLIRIKTAVRDGEEADEVSRKDGPRRDGSTHQFCTQCLSRKDGPRRDGSTHQFCTQCLEDVKQCQEESFDDLLIFNALLLCFVLLVVVKTLYYDVAVRSAQELCVDV